MRNSEKKTMIWLFLGNGVRDTNSLWPASGHSHLGVLVVHPPVPPRRRGIERGVPRNFTARFGIQGNIRLPVVQRDVQHRQKLKPNYNKSFLGLLGPELPTVPVLNWRCGIYAPNNACIIPTTPKAATPTSMCRPFLGHHGPSPGSFPRAPV